MAVLETSMTSKTRENMKKLPKNNKKQVKKVLVVAQELKLARILAGNNKTARDRALKSLKKWFQNRSTAIPFTEDDFLRLWKGLFYSMWMSDKPLIQEECAENISNLIHALPLEGALLFYKSGMTILINEWFGIDQLRLDKFLMFVRRLLRQVLFVIKNQNWTRDSAHKFTQVLSETILDSQHQKPMGLLMHFIEIYLEELAKVSDGKLPPQLITELLGPFIKQLAFSDDLRVIDHIRKHIFIYLIRQSELGLEYDEKFKAWRALRFPGSIDAMQKVEVSDDEEDEAEEQEQIYDPRAGKVNVKLPQLKFHAKAVSKALLQCRFAKETNSKSRKCLTELAEHFRKLGSGTYPLGVKKVKLATDDYDTNVRKAVNRLVKFDKKIKGTKNRKRKAENEMQLRGGKRVKIDEKLREMLQDDLVRVIKKKRKFIDDTPESPPEKQRKKELKLQVEFIIKRNSGTWLVTKAVQRELKKVNEEKVLDKNNEKEKVTCKTPNIIYPKNKREVSKNKEKKVSGSKPNIIFPKNKWENSNNHTTDEPEKILRNSRLSLPTNLIKNPFSNSSPVKKVKINTKLNRSQDVQEHHAQILSSPGIPYDAQKKPSKPLLKTPTMTSPINPFYVL